MKEFIKNRLKESIDRTIIERLLDEDYPTTWNVEEFKQLKSFVKRVKYCEENLQRISSGSSRIVYKIDDTKVLKLARNKKGVAQNDLEISQSHYTDISDITAKIFAYDNDGLWTEMELARKVTPAIFKSVTGFDFNDYCKVIYNHGIDANGRDNMHKYSINGELVEAMWEEEFCYAMFNFVANYKVPTGDLTKLSSYGVVNRNGRDDIVMIDYGLNNEIYTSYYN